MENRIHYSLKGIIITIILGILIKSIQVKEIAIDLWLKGYLNYFGKIADYFNLSGWGYAMFGFAIIIEFFTFLIQKWYYTLLTYFIIRGIIWILFESVSGKNVSEKNKN